MPESTKINSNGSCSSGCWQTGTIPAADIKADPAAVDSANDGIAAGCGGRFAWCVSAPVGVTYDVEVYADCGDGMVRVYQIDPTLYVGIDGSRTDAMDAGPWSRMTIRVVNEVGGAITGARLRRSECC